MLASAFPDTARTSVCADTDELAASAVIATARGDAVGCWERMRAPNSATAGRAYQLPKVAGLPLSDLPFGATLTHSRERSRGKSKSLDQTSRIGKEVTHRGGLLRSESSNWIPRQGSSTRTAASSGCSR